MAVLAKCWLIIECSLIPDGFMKWFFLSFYIHPFFLFFCQIYLWIKTLQRWIFLVIFLLDRYIFSRVSGVLRRFLIIPRSFSGFNDGGTEVEDDDLWYEVSDSDGSSNTASGILFLRYEDSYEVPNIVFHDVHVESIDQETVSVCSSSDLDDESKSFSGASSPISSYSFASRRDMEVIQNIPSSSSSTLTEDQVIVSSDEARNELEDFPTPILVKTDEEEEEEEEEEDLFYKSYTERMTWFDLLNEERTYGLNAFLANKQYLGGEKRIVKSLESDFEMVYVAQSCLSWEALHDQYKKLEGIVASYADATCTSSPYGALCTSTLVTKFQRFQILIERFMEDEKSEKGKRYWNYIQKRSSLKSLLQVPKIEVSGRNGGLMIRATDVLKTIEKCMKTFKSFIEVDAKKPWWRGSNRLSWSRSPLEDPRDLNHLHDLTRTLRQKEAWMKDLKGKKRCWWSKRARTLEEIQKKEMMFAMIELKLVSRVLMMSVISTSQLHWCQQKLNNIHISHGRITRSCNASLLFPPS